MKALALGMHDIVEPGALDASGFPGPAAGHYKIDAAAFSGYLEAIAAVLRKPPERGTGPGVFRAEEVPFFLTFDDGGASALRTADALDRFGWKGYFLVTADFVGTPGFMTEAEIRQVHTRGHVIGSHSRSHPGRMSSLPYAELLTEWGGSAERLSHIIGERVVVASVPGGYSSLAVSRAAAESGMRLLFTSEPTMRVRMVDGCAVLGRFAVVRGTPAEVVGALAAGQPGPRWRQSLLWTMKKTAKIIGGRYYLKLRRFVFSRTGVS